MTEVSWKITCDNCGQELQETEEICPNCHSNKKTALLQVREGLHLATSERIKVKKDQYPSNKKLRYDLMQGNVSSKKTDNGRAKIKRIIDKDNDYYYEHVEDCNGTVIHHCEEALSKHFGHGTAKNSNDNSHTPD
mgnify:FL=1